VSTVVEPLLAWRDPNAPGNDHRSPIPSRGPALQRRPWRACCRGLYGARRHDRGRPVPRGAMPTAPTARRPSAAGRVPRLRKSIADEDKAPSGTRPASPLASLRLMLDVGFPIGGVPSGRHSCTPPPTPAGQRSSSGSWPMAPTCTPRMGSGTRRRWPGRRGAAGERPRYAWTRTGRARCAALLAAARLPGTPGSAANRPSTRVPRC